MVFQFSFEIGKGSWIFNFHRERVPKLYSKIMDRSQPILSRVTGNSIQIVFHRLASTNPMDSVDSGKIISRIYRGNVIGIFIDKRCHL